VKAQVRSALKRSMLARWKKCFSDNFSSLSALNPSLYLLEIDDNFFVVGRFFSDNFVVLCGARP
jgi:hypothetical protein